MTGDGPTTTAQRHVAVIGAGVSGLAAAHRLISQDPTVRVTVFDAASRIGGIVQTVRQDDFLIEMGPDSFITNKPGAVQLADEIGFSDQLIPTDEAWRRSLVLRKGRPQPVPDGFMLMAPAKPMAIVTTPILSLPGKLRLLAEALIPRSKGNQDESLASFVRRRFGRETLDRLVQPLIGGIYTSDPEKLSIRATLPRFPEMEERFGSVIRGTLRQQSAGRRAESGLGEDRGRTSAPADSAGSGARYALFLTARDGLSSMMEAIAAACRQSERVSFRLGTRVEFAEREDRIESLSRNPTRSLSKAPQWRLRIVPAEAVRPQSGAESHRGGDDFIESFDAVIVTLPTHAAARILPHDEFAGLRNALNAIEYASSAIVVSGHRLVDFVHPLDAFGLVIPHQEQRRILATSFSSRKFPGRAPDGHVLLRTFVGGAMQPELLQKSDEEIVQLVDEELRSIFGMSRSALFSNVVRYNHAMPQYHVGHLDRVSEIERQCAAFSGLALAGSSYRGVGIPDSISSARDAADNVLRTAD